MKMLKRATQILIPPPPGPGVKRMQPQPDWLAHPSLIAAIENLDAYNEWVSEVVLPIAFQWIEEHKSDVYASVAEENKDDVGVVIAAAYEIVKTKPIFQKGVEATKQFEEDRVAGRVDYASLNPVWTKIVKRVREASHSAFHHEKSVLKDTIRAVKPE